MIEKIIAETTRTVNYYNIKRKLNKKISQHYRIQRLVMTKQDFADLQTNNLSNFVNANTVKLFGRF